ncbi:hypothetical protein [Bradyrhizobium embrapense]
MSHSNRDLLRRFFVLGYDDLRARLTRRLGSAELANDVRHDTWLRLDRAAPSGELRSPKSYLIQRPSMPRCRAGEARSAW